MLYYICYDIMLYYIILYIIYVIGSITVVLSQSDGTFSPSLLGNLLLLAHSLSMAVLLVGQKMVKNKHSPLKTTAMYYTIG